MVEKMTPNQKHYAEKAAAVVAEYLAGKIDTEDLIDELDMIVTNLQEVRSEELGWEPDWMKWDKDW